MLDVRRVDISVKNTRHTVLPLCSFVLFVVLFRENFICSNPGHKPLKNPPSPHPVYDLQDIILDKLMHLFPFRAVRFGPPQIWVL